MIIYSEYVLAKYLFVLQNCGEVNCKNPLKYNGAKNDFLECSLLGVSHPEQPYYIIDAEIPPQECSSVTTEPDDDGMADYFDRYAFANKKEPALSKGGVKVENINQVCKVWMHTHPHESAKPSGTDTTTFAKWFEKHKFAAMQILAKNLDHYSYVKYNTMFDVTRSSEETTSVVIEETNELMEIDDYFKKAKAIFEIKNLCKKHGLPDYNHSMLDRFSEHYATWMEEIKENVSRKVYTQTNHGGHHMGFHQQNKYTQIGHGHSGHLEGYGKAQKNNRVKKNVGLVLPSELAEACAENKIESYKDLESKKHSLIRKFNCEFNDIKRVFKNITKNEKKVTIETVGDIRWMSDYLRLEIDVDSIDQIKEGDIVEVAGWLEVRRSHAIKVLKKHIESLKGEKEVK